MADERRAPSHVAYYDGVGWTTGRGPGGCCSITAHTWQPDGRDPPPRSTGDSSVSARARLNAVRSRVAYRNARSGHHRGEEPNPARDDERGRQAASGAETRFGTKSQSQHAHVPGWSESGRHSAGARYHREVRIQDHKTANPDRMEAAASCSFPRWPWSWTVRKPGERPCGSPAAEHPSPNLNARPGAGSFSQRSLSRAGEMNECSGTEWCVLFFR